MKDRSLGFKFYGVMCILMAASLGIAAIGLGKMSEIKDSLQSIVNGSAARVGNAHELKELFLIQIINEKNLVMEDNPEEIKIHLKRLTDRDEQIRKQIEGAHKSSTSEGKRDLGNLTQYYNEWWNTEKEIISLVQQSKQAEAIKTSSVKGREYRLKIEALLDEVVKRNEDFMYKDAEEAEADYMAARNFVIVFSIGSIVFGFAVGSYVIRSVVKSVDEVISILNDGSGQVSNASQQIASASEELSESTSEQAASLEETVSSIEEMNSMVQRNAENALRTSQLSTSSSGSADKGKKVVTDMIQAIDDIHRSNTDIKKQIDESNEQISEIVHVIAEIADKTKVINDIVFQTKLLSFNASVEAARAGEHGKGFAVVAEEVGSLAQMSGNAATEISAMLQSSIQKVETIVTDTKTKVAKLIEDGEGKVSSGLKIARDCGSVLDEIVDNVADVTQMANEISTACNEQALGVQEITKAMNQLDQVTQANAATSEQVASSAEELSGQANSLRHGVQVLVRTIKGAGAEVKVEKIEAIPEIANKTARIVEFKRPVKKSVPMPTMKRVSGDERSIPSEHDERFEDV